MAFIDSLVMLLALTAFVGGAQEGIECEVANGEPCGDEASLLHVHKALQAPSTDNDFQTELHQRQSFPESDFVFKFETVGDSTSYGSLRPEQLPQNPVLGTLPRLGVSQVLITLAPCAVNQPHIHPRGTEVPFVTKGSITFGFQEENGGRLIRADLRTGQSIVIPQGLMHFGQNKGCEEVEFLSSFDSADPGLVTIASQFFKLPLSVIRATIDGVDEDDLVLVGKMAISTDNPSVDHECLRRCQIH